MRVLTATDLLQVWEHGQTCGPVERILSLLALAYPEMSLQQLEELPIGPRDTRLMEIREALFGQRAVCLTSCPECDERLEIGFDISQVRSSSSELPSPESCLIKVDDCEVQFRLPNSQDMLAIADMPDVDRARRELFEKCVQSASRAGEQVSPVDLPEEIVSLVSAQMVQRDPQADIQIALNCPACSHQWSAVFDIASYLWIEINAWAVRVLHEVHMLASTYGWPEKDILALNSMRRQFYLELIG